MIGVLSPRLFTVRIYWAEDNLGEWDEFCYESCPWRRIDHSTCWPVVQRATTVPEMPPGRHWKNPIQSVIDTRWYNQSQIFIACNMSHFTVANMPGHAVPGDLCHDEIEQITLLLPMRSTTNLIFQAELYNVISETWCEKQQNSLSSCTTPQEWMNGLLGQDSALSRLYWANGMNFVLNYTPDAGSISRPVDQQPSRYHATPDFTEIDSFELLVNWDYVIIIIPTFQFNVHHFWSERQLSR